MNAVGVLGPRHDEFLKEEEGTASLPRNPIKCSSDMREASAV
jgi:hypothetical protein